LSQILLLHTATTGDFSHHIKSLLKKDFSSNESELPEITEVQIYVSNPCRIRESIEEVIKDILTIYIII